MRLNKQAEIQSPLCPVSPRLLRRGTWSSPWVASCSIPSPVRDLISAVLFLARETSPSHELGTKAMTSGQWNSTAWHWWAVGGTWQAEHSCAHWWPVDRHCFWGRLTAKLSALGSERVFLRL
jgi:hypothetical protein